GEQQHRTREEKIFYNKIQSGHSTYSFDLNLESMLVYLWTALLNPPFSLVFLDYGDIPDN
ncbi:hypothetical protein Csa_023776, partial [Cucumis sativus]